MAQPVIQTAFHAGEWADALNARVDLAKYRSAAKLALNYFVDYRGGASSRPGTKYVLQAYKSNKAVRLITFQASFLVGYVLELGDFYMRFYNDGSPVVETAINITAATKANPCVITVPGHNYSVGEWIYLTGILGMTELNGKYYSISAIAGNNISLANLNGVAINSTAYTTYTSGGTAQRVYTITTPWAAADLSLLKFTQDVSKMYFDHTSYETQILTLISATNWTLLSAAYGSTMTAPTSVAVTTTLGNLANGVNYAYVVTSVDANGQESTGSTPGTLAGKQDLRTTAGTNTITWVASPGAASYNVYKAEVVYNAGIPVGAAYGFIGNCVGTTFNDSNIAPDFTEAVPIGQNPFSGAGVASVTVTVPDTYTTVPTVSAAAAPVGGATAVLGAVLTVQSAAINNAGTGYAVGDTVTFSNGVVLVVATVGGSGQIISYQPLTYPGSSVGSVSIGAVPSNPMSKVSTSGSGTGTTRINATWGVGYVNVFASGAGYLSAPALTFSSGAAAATAVLGATSAGNPGVPGFCWQRFIQAGPVQAPQTLYMSQPGSPLNFDITNPTLPADAITITIKSGQLNTIKALVPQPVGLIVLTDKAAWLVNGGQNNEPITPINADANTHSFNGISDVPPIVMNSSILFVQSKGSIIRDLAYNYYTNIFTGTDISVLSSHLFFDYQILEWALAEEPFKLVWAVRDDGMALSLTFMKEQELIGWMHSDTQGAFKSVATVTEGVDGFGSTDAPYWVVEREINGNTVKYIERMADRIWTTMQYAWCVDAGLRYEGTARTTFTGAEHLAGCDVVGLASGIPFEATVSASGSFSLPAGMAASGNVLVGLSFTPDFQTLNLDLGEPTVQSKLKKVSEVAVRVKDTLGLEIGTDFDNLVAMKDLILGNVGSQSNEIVTNLFTGDAMTILNPLWDNAGQYCIRQPYPLPSTILGVIPWVDVGDTKK